MQDDDFLKKKKLKNNTFNTAWTKKSRFIYIFFNHDLIFIAKSWSEIFSRTTNSKNKILFCQTIFAKFFSCGHFFNANLD
jgi:hypothetical protein